MSSRVDGIVTGVQQSGALVMSYVFMLVAASEKAHVQGPCPIP